jgi:hypothetical protein
MHEVFVLPMVLGMVYYANNIFNGTGKQQYNFSLLIIFIFFGVATDWFAVLVAAGLIFYGWFILKSKIYIIFSAIVLFTTVFSIGMFLSMYASCTSWSFVLSSLQQKFLSRAPDELSRQESSILWSILKNIITICGPVLLLYLSVMVKNKVKQNNILVYSLLLPALVYNIALIRFSSNHEYAFLKVLLACTVMCFAYFQLKNSIQKKLIVGYMLLNIVLYYCINLPGKNSIKGVQYDREQKISLQLKNMVQANEHIFCYGGTYNTAAIIYYAQRNIKFLSSKSDFEQYIATSKSKAMVLIDISNFNSIQSVK